MYVIFFFDVFLLTCEHVQGVYGAYFSKLNVRWSRDVRGKSFLGSHSMLEVFIVSSLSFCMCLVRNRALIDHARYHPFMFPQPLYAHEWY